MGDSQVLHSVCQETGGVICSILTEERKECPSSCFVQRGEQRGGQNDACLGGPGRRWYSDGLGDHDDIPVQPGEPYLFSVSFMMVFPRVEKTMKDIRSIGLKEQTNRHRKESFEMNADD